MGRNMSYMDGPGSRNAQNVIGDMHGLNLKSLKVHYSLVPLFVVCGFSMVVVVAYLGKLATKKETGLKLPNQWNTTVKVQVQDSSDYGHMSLQRMAHLFNARHPFIRIKPH